MPDPDKPEADATHTDSGAPTDEAHRQAGDGTLQGSVPAGAGPDDASAGESVDAGTG